MQITWLPVKEDTAQEHKSTQAQDDTEYFSSEGLAGGEQPGARTHPDNSGGPVNPVDPTADPPGPAPEPEPEQPPVEPEQPSVEPERPPTEPVTETTRA